MVLAAITVQAAFVQAYADKDPARAAAIWSSHPKILFQVGLAEIGDQAAAGKPVDELLVNRLVSASARAPLAPEPFLVRGVKAELAGNPRLALRAFLAARQRSPRAIAPRYFLADHYLKTGQIGPGLAEIAVLARLVPESRPKLAPYLAAYAGNPSAAPQIRAMLKSHPELETTLLNELAGDAANARLALYLWSGRSGEAARSWQLRLLNTLVDAGRYGEARSAWTQFTGISAGRDSLFDPEFKAEALAPFGWKLASGRSGTAEPLGEGRLHAIHYGRDDLVLASQLLTLPAGRYILSMDVMPGSPAPKSLSWTMRCLPGSNLIASIEVNRSGALATPITVPAQGCAAQRLELGGIAPEFPEQSEVTIGRLKLQREAGR